MNRKLLIALTTASIAATSSDALLARGDGGHGHGKGHGHKGMSIGHSEGKKKNRGHTSGIEKKEHKKEEKEKRIKNRRAKKHPITNPNAATPAVPGRGIVPTVPAVPGNPNAQQNVEENRR